jgi:hypothetical protein
LKLSLQRRLPLFAVAQAGFEFAFTKAQDMRADLKGLFVGGESAGGRVLFLTGAAPAFVEGLHPEGFGGVGHGFGEAM